MQSITIYAAHELRDLVCLALHVVCTRFSVPPLRAVRIKMCAILRQRGRVYASQSHESGKECTRCRDDEEEASWVRQVEA